MAEIKEKLTSEMSIKALFEPASVAVIGASRRKESVGSAVVSNLVAAKFKGEIYPINPKVDVIQGLKCYPSILETPGSVDLAVIILPSSAVPDIMRECVQKGVKAVVVISAGFREVGPEGKKLEEEVIRIAREAGIRVMGPNCLGHINTDPKISLNASFSPSTPVSGKIAFVSQSGALCAAILDYAKGEHIGFSKFVSFGNKADLTELDLLRYLKDDPQTNVILMYVEDLVDGQAFINLAREITGEVKKPILAIKSGRTAQGAKAAKSHTGSLMGSDEVYDAIFMQSGVIRVDSVEEMFEYAMGFAHQPIPKSNRVAIVTNAGGPGIMATDACVKSGLEIAEIGVKTTEELKKVLPPTSNFSNPIDVIGDAQHDRYESALQHVLADQNVDSLFVILTPQAMTEIEETARVIVDMKKKTDKTMVACFMGGADVSRGAKILKENDIPNYPFPGEAAKTLGAMVRYKVWLDRPRTNVKKFSVDSAKAAQVIEAARKEKQRLLNVAQSMDVLKAYGFPVPAFGVAASETEVGKVAADIGFPVAMKIISQKIVHKLDVGGVKLNLKTKEEAKGAYRQILEALKERKMQDQIDGVFIQAMGQKGREVILGMNRDAHFGPMIMFGLGGTYVEVFKDVTFRLAPMRELSVKRMVGSIRSYPILKGVRGQAPADTKTIIECLQRLSQLSCEQSEIQEIDINPLLVYDQGQGAQVIDARIVLK
jgi:acetyltransferase